jgi:hypothetical protein
VQSINGPTVTVIQGNRVVGDDAVRCVYLTNDALLVGFTLTNGATRADQFEGDPSQLNGGGAWCEPNGGAILSNCILVANSAFDSGGGAYFGTLTSCVISNNSASCGGGGAHGGTLLNCTIASNSVGGGVCAGASGGGAFQAVLSNCTVFGNSATYGGGAASSTLENCIVMTNNAFGFFGGAPRGGGAVDSVLKDCLLLGNAATSLGGGASHSTLDRCTLIGNRTLTTNAFVGSYGLGGGAYSSTLNHCSISQNCGTNSGGGAYGGTLNNCIVSSNWAQHGGGVASATANNCTIAGNVASSRGGGSVNSTANNSVIYYNTASNNPNWYSTTRQACCTTPNLPPVMPGVVRDYLTNEPRFMDPANGDFRLQDDSPCINAGKNIYATNSVDIDGNPRIVGGTVDIGAYEFPSPSSAISYGWLQLYGLPIDGSADYEDTDDDGMNNWQELQAGTVPTNALSNLQFINVVNDAMGLKLTWRSVIGRTYYLQRAVDLGSPGLFSTIATNIIVYGPPDSITYTDTTTTNGGPFFYRVGIQE